MPGEMSKMCVIPRAMAKARFIVKFHLKKTEGTESIETMVSASLAQPSSDPVSSILANAGSRGNSTMLRKCGGGG